MRANPEAMNTMSSTKPVTMVARKRAIAAAPRAILMYFLTGYFPKAAVMRGVETITALMRALSWSLVRRSVFT